MSRKAPKTLEAQLRGAVAYVPADLLVDGRVSDSGVRLYALVRALGPGSDTFRGKDSLALALGWSRRKLFRVADSLEKAGWLDRTRVQKGASWVSVWSVSKRSRVSPLTPTSPLTGVSPLTPSATPGSATNDTRECHQWHKRGSVTNGTREPTPKPKPTQEREGLSSSILTKTKTVEASIRSLTSWDRDNAPAGWETLADSLVSLLDRKLLPKGTTEATLVLAFLERIRSRKPLRGITSPEGLLVREARGRDQLADLDTFRELLQVGLERLERPDRPEEFLDLSGLEGLDGLADSLASPETNTRGSLSSYPVS